MENLSQSGKRKRQLLWKEEWKTSEGCQVPIVMVGDTVSNSEEIGSFINNIDQSRQDSLTKPCPLTHWLRKSIFVETKTCISDLDRHFCDFISQNQISLNGEGDRVPFSSNTSTPLDIVRTPGSEKSIYT